MTFALLVQSAIIGTSLGSIYILMALGLTLMFGMMHIINFAHGAVYMLGAFVIYYVFFQGGTSSSARSTGRSGAASSRRSSRSSPSPRFSRRPATRSSASSTSTCRRSFRAPGTFSASAFPSSGS